MSLTVKKSSEEVIHVNNKEYTCRRKHWHFRQPCQLYLFPLNIFKYLKFRCYSSISASYMGDIFLFFCSTLPRLTQLKSTFQKNRYLFNWLKLSTLCDLLLNSNSHPLFTIYFYSILIILSYTLKKFILNNKG